MRTIEGSKQWTVAPAPEDPEDHRTDEQLMAQLTTEYFREHHRTAKALCKTMGLTFAASTDHSIFRPANNRNRPYGKIPFWGQHPDGTRERFELLIPIKQP